jgi:multiple sugar transport system substrate-binding protein
MKPLYGTAAAAGLLIFGAGAAAADCGIEQGSVRILSNDFEVLHIIAAPPRNAPPAASR